jgi:hypothetical protein
MPCFVAVEITIHDPARYERYKDGAAVDRFLTAAGMRCAAAQ